MKRIGAPMFLVAAIAAAAPLPAQERNPVDWPTFLARQDLTWTELPRKWFDAPFLGNGMLGTLVRQTGDHEVRWDVGRSDVHDHRPVDDYGVRTPEILNRGRLPIGCFVLRTSGAITGGDIRLDLWNAEATGVIRTDAGEVEWRTLVHAEEMAFFVELEGRAGEVGCAIEFVPEKAESTRFTANRGRLPESFVALYPPNPEPAITDLGDGLHLCEQRLVAGGATATAWHLGREGARTELLVTVEHTFPGTEARERAVTTIRRVLDADREAWIAAHRAWWHAYYPASFVSVSDERWEQFYWRQMYKLACATRADRALIDNQGPWLQPTGWNGAWWNLNVQLSYSPVYTANRLELGESLTNHLRRNLRNLIENVEPEFRYDSAGITRNTSMNDLSGRVGRPGGWEYPNIDIGTEVGNLAWTCHNVYRQYRFSLDDEMLEELLYPLLTRAINYYRHFLFEGEDGKLHLPPTHSPEYRTEPVPDCNYDLALIRWGCRTLLELAERRGVDDPLVPEWRRILEKLVDAPTNEHGLMVGAGVGFDHGHRHFSHLLSVYPLHVATPENGAEELIRTSLARGHSFGTGLAGYSFTGGASIAALLGDGDRACEYLNGFHPYMGASTMYFEAGRLPVMETPLHAAQAMQEMLLQSWGGVIRVFPAVPAAWSEVAFDDLRAEGAILVSARREAGVTRWVRIESLAGEPCRVKADLPPPVRVEVPEGVMVQRVGDLLELELPRGASALIVGG